MVQNRVARQIRNQGALQHAVTAPHAALARFLLLPLMPVDVEGQASESK